MASFPCRQRCVTTAKPDACRAGQRPALRRSQRAQRAVSAAVYDQDYHEHTLGARSDSRSVAYIRCVFPQGESYWGVGIDNDVARASLQALCNALSAADQAGDENSRWGDAHHPTKHGAEGAVATVAQLQRHPQHR